MISVEWGNAEETLLIWRFAESWTLKDFYSALKRSKKMVYKQSETINLMIDMRVSRTWNSMMLLLVHAVLSFKPSEASRTVVISANPIYKQLWKTSQRLYGVIDYPIYFVATVDEAYCLVSDIV